MRSKAERARRTCSKKVRYCAGDAERIAGSLNSRDPKLIPCQVFHCGVCGYFHVGRPTEAQVKKKEELLE